MATTGPIAATESEQAAPAYMVLLWLVATQIVWAFAFAGTPEATPEWLRRARSVCFGADESGIPDMRGWMLLVLAPLSMLAALFVTYRADLSTAFRALFRQRIAIAFLSLLILASLWQALSVSVRIADGLDVIRSRAQAIDDLSHLPEAYPQLRQAAPDFELVNQFGERASLVSFRNRPLILSFVFAHCQTVCPLITRNVNSVAERLAPQGVSVAYITLDPRRDTPSSLAQLADQWGLPAHTFVLSGTVAEVERVLQRYNTGAQRDGKTGDIVHPALIYVIDGNGLIRYALSNPATNWILEAVQRVLAEQ